MCLPRKKAEAEDDDKEDDDKSLAAVPRRRTGSRGRWVGDDLKTPSKNMQKRIARERRIRDREREEPRPLS